MKPSNARRRATSIDIIAYRDASFDILGPAFSTWASHQLVLPAASWDLVARELGHERPEHIAQISQVRKGFLMGVQVKRFRGKDTSTWIAHMHSHQTLGQGCSHPDSRTCSSSGLPSPATSYEKRTMLKMGKEWFDSSPPMAGRLIGIDHVLLLGPALSPSLASSVHHVPRKAGGVDHPSCQGAYGCTVEPLILEVINCQCCRSERFFK